jgi:hypothetical protein
VHFLHDSPLELETFETFATALTTIYGDPNLERTTEHKLHYFVQTGSVANYIAGFQSLRQFVQWNEGALYSHFYEGLKDPIKNQIVLQGFTLAELQAFATRLDARMYDCAIERHHAGGGPVMLSSSLAISRNK